MERTNIIIAEFMSEFPLNISDIKDMSNFEYKSIKFSDLKYHSSWDWLMDVVIKIEKLGYYVEIRSYKNTTRVSIGNEDFNTNPIAFQFSIIEKITIVYNVVLQFIEWYQLNKDAAKN